MRKISASLDRLIKENNSDQLNEFGEKLGKFYSSETIDKIKQTIVMLRFVEIFTNRIAYLLSGDISEHSFNEQRKEDMKLLSEEASAFFRGV
jgi:hypothetical protein